MLQFRVSTDSGSRLLKLLFPSAESTVERPQGSLGEGSA